VFPLHLCILLQIIDLENCKDVNLTGEGGIGQKKRQREREKERKLES
jgi:hypothetical protein